MKNKIFVYLTALFLFVSCFTLPVFAAEYGTAYVENGFFYYIYEGVEYSVDIRNFDGVGLDSTFILEAVPTSYESRVPEGTMPYTIVCYDSATEFPFVTKDPATNSVQVFYGLRDTEDDVWHRNVHGIVGYVNTDGTYQLLNQGNVQVIFKCAEDQTADELLHEVKDFIVYTDNNICLYDQESGTCDEVFFRAPLSMVEAVRGADLAMTMEGVLKILPIGLACLVGFVTLRKALSLCLGILFRG